MFSSCEKGSTQTVFPNSTYTFPLSCFLFILPSSSVHQVPHIEKAIDMVDLLLAKETTNEQVSQFLSPLSFFFVIGRKLGSS